ncbi:MAG: hypothetical protein LBQ55_00505 [Treponema sp.]|jgi:hypothetical protein|nr:hypothetical protein [Treponema sp.]
MKAGPRRGFLRRGTGPVVPWAELALGIICFFQVSLLFPQQPLAAGAHHGAVRAILQEGDKLYSAGDDGFLGIWDIRGGFCEERFQLSSSAILAMVKRPGRTELGVIESDGMGLYRISVWDYAEKTKRFSLRFRDPLTYINYSARGSFIIAARTGRTSLVIVDAETGDLLPSPENLTGAVSFAATGRSERGMVIYQPQGIISYWDLESGEERDSLRVPPNLASPLIFGENRFFAGLDSGGLVILDAVSGELLARNGGTPAPAALPSLLFAGRDETELYWFTGALPASGSPGPGLYHFSVDGGGRLRTLDRGILTQDQRSGAGSFSAGVNSVTAGTVWKGGAALGNSSGLIWFTEGGTAKVMETKNQEKILETAASGPVLALLTGNGLGFIPLDYSRLGAGETLSLEEPGPYRRITGIPREDSLGAFLLWQDGNTRAYPLVRTSEKGDGGFILKNLPLRFPLRTAAAAGDRALFLDSRGNVSVLRLDREAGTGESIFSYSAVGAMDAAFLENGVVILGRSAVSGNTPFLMINTVTGETVPVPHDSDAGGMVYRGASGALYGAAVKEEGDAVKTTLLRIDPARPEQTEPLIEFQGEDILFAMAESAGLPASTLGGEGAAIIGPEGLAPLERTPGFPLRLVDGGASFVALDAEGNVSWHDPRTGKILALFTLYRDEWTLVTKDGNIRGTVVSGP